MSKERKITKHIKDLKPGSFRDYRSALSDHDTVRQALSVLRASTMKTTDDDYISVGKDTKEEKKTMILLGDSLLTGVSVARNLFKRDHPYRTTLALMGSVATSAAGVMATNYNAATMTSSVEWSGIVGLFDEVFLHSLTLKFMPRNHLGGGQGVSTAGVNAVTTVAGPNAVMFSQGLILCSLFNGAGLYTSAVSMGANPTHKLVHSGHPFKYTWRNNVRFEKHGPAISASTTESWQGWTFVANAANYGGAIQLRTIADNIFGDGAHANVLGDYLLLYDLSFRARS